MVITGITVLHVQLKHTAMSIGCHQRARAALLLLEPLPGALPHLNRADRNTAVQN